MLERFTKERQRTSSRSAAFNLEDDHELTHYGQSLSNIDDFDTLAFDDRADGNEDDAESSSNLVHRHHFGGFEDDQSDPVCAISSCGPIHFQHLLFSER